ncbi:hypothetical protein ACFLZW_06125, partial [Chloroflexota bacterium]
MELIITAISAALIGAGLTAIIYTIRDDRRRLTELEETISKKRHGHGTQAALEDVSAILGRIVKERQIEDIYIRDAQSKLGIELHEPNSYDPETPSGHKPQ